MQPAFPTYTYTLFACGYLFAADTQVARPIKLELNLATARALVQTFPVPFLPHAALIELIEILPHGAPAGDKATPVSGFRAGDGSLLVGVFSNQAGVHGKFLATNQPFLDTAAHHRLKDMPERIAVAKAAMGFFEKVE